MNEKNFVRIKILNDFEKKEIEKKLKEKFKIEKIDGIIIRKGKDRLFLFSGDIEKKEIEKIQEITIIERIGIYFAKIVDKEIKLSIEGVEILKNQIKKNIFEINDEQTIKWMKGENLEIKIPERGFIIIKNKDYFLGSGKVSYERIGNFIPKSRRLK